MSSEIILSENFIEKNDVYDNIFMKNFVCKKTGKIFLNPVFNEGQLIEASLCNNLKIVTEVKQFIDDYLEQNPEYKKHRYSNDDIFNELFNCNVKEVIIKFFSKITPEVMKKLCNYKKFNVCAKLLNGGLIYVFYEFVFLHAPFESVKVFMEFTGMDANFLPNNYWVTPLYLACIAKRDELILYLIKEKNGNVNLKPSGFTETMHRKYVKNFYYLYGDDEYLYKASSTYHKYHIDFDQIKHCDKEIASLLVPSQ